MKKREIRLFIRVLIIEIVKTEIIKVVKKLLIEVK
jgi:hypothetical protein